MVDEIVEELRQYDLEDALGGSDEETKMMMNSEIS